MTTARRQNPKSRTKVEFDLKDILSEPELQQFQKSAEEAKAPNVTEHFLNLTLRLNPKVA